MIAAEAKPAIKDIEDQLGRILRSKVFASSQRSQTFLKYVVHKSLSDGPPPKEFVIAVDVFERDSSYDPAVDATVRVQAGRLRSRLREYYDGDGKDDPIVISIPTGSYVPVYTVREQTSDSSSKLPTPTRKIRPLETNTVPQFRSIFSFSAQVLVPIAALCLIVLTATMLMHRQAQSDSPVHSLAVLPLVNLSQDPTMEYFADGMTEELTTDLSYVKALRVVSRASTIGFKKSNLSVQQIAGQLQVDAVIEGTVLRANNTIRVTVRLTTAKPERQIWAASYERNLSDAITLQDQIAAEAVTQIRVQLTPEERTRLSLENRISPEAYDEYLRARFLLAQETKQRNKAIPHLERAINLDPNFAAAYAALGEAWSGEERAIERLRQRPWNTRKRR
jgi:TolB-like protein